MSCFPCFTSRRSKSSNGRIDVSPSKQNDIKKPKAEEITHGDIDAQSFTFRELASATKNFRHEFLQGEGGFGRVYKGTLPGTQQVVAVKQLDRNGTQGNKEFLLEVLTISLLRHENLVKLVGYCADGDQRLLVYEFMPGGSLEDRLIEVGVDKKALDWQTRMKIAAGAAKALEYLHHTANPPVIYRDLKSSNILLDQDLNPKLSDFGLANLGSGGKNHISSMGTYGYCAPEYVRSGQITSKSDVYSFGVVLLELITGRRAVDTTKPNSEQNLVSWAEPLFKDPKKFPDMADPLLNKQFPEKNLNQAVAIAAMCLQEEPDARPLISDVLTALSFLSMTPPEVVPPPNPVAAHNSMSNKSASSESDQDVSDDDDDEDEDDDKYSSTHGPSFNKNAGSSKYKDSDVSDSEDDDECAKNDHPNSSNRRKASISFESESGSFASGRIEFPSSPNGSSA